MVAPTVKIEGLDDAMKAMAAAFPKNPKQQRSLLNSAMRASAMKTILPSAKRRALRGDGSGALSEALGIRTQSRAKMKSKKAAAGVEIVPVRRNLKAIAMYINHYYTSMGKTAPANIATSGIRHGHLVEFGSRNNAARPFLFPAAQSKKTTYISQFAKFLKKRTEAAVKRKAKKAGKK